MKPELENKLFEKYPKIFKQKDLPMSQTCMCWGIATGNGWFKLINQLCSQLQWNTDRNNYPQVEATQVKEKFGTLRFYYSATPVKENEHTERQFGVIDGMVSFAEALSGEICEHCGSTEEVTQTKGWISTFCKKCLEVKNIKGDRKADE